MMKRVLTLTAVAAVAIFATVSVASAATIQLHLPFDSETAGISADSSGNGNDATLLGNAAIDNVSYKVGGGALTLDGNPRAGDGNSSHASITGYKGIGGGADRTVAFWVNSTGPSLNGTNGPTMVSWGGGTVNGERYDINASTGLDKLRVEVQGGYDSTATVTLYDGSWHHVAVVLDSSLGTQVGQNTVFYIDGVGVAATSANTRVVNTLLTNDVRIGDSYHSGTREFLGLIDDVQIYSGALTADQVQYLNDNPGVAIPEPSSLVLMLLVCVGLLAHRNRK